MRVIRLSQPASEPVTLAEAKAQLRIRFSDDDTQIEAFISASRQRVEDYCNRPFVSSSWAVLYEGGIPLRDAALPVPLPDVSAVTAISYRDASDVVQTFTAFTYDAERQELRPDDAWPDGTDMRVAVTAGNDDSPLFVPAPIKVAILMYVAEMYENREAAHLGKAGEKYDINPAAVSLMQPYRVRMGM